MGELSDDVDQELFREVIGHFMTGVTVITATHAGEDYGMSASSVASLSLEPPMLLACLNRASPTQRAVSASRAFCVNVLAEDQHELAVRFGRSGPDKFMGVAFERGRVGAPLLSEALACLECEVEDDVRGGATHRVLLARVVHASAREGTPLAYFRGGFGRLDPVGDPLAPIDVEALEQAFDARLAIELGAVDLCVGRAPAEQLARLRALMQEANALVRDGRFADARAYVRANQRAHEQLVSMAGSEALLHAYRRLSIPTMMARLFGDDDSAGADLVADHLEIVEALEAGDAARARRALVAHTAGAKRNNADALRSLGGEA
jgi:flavin reductase (DIM6/NTAB) family NADH-FMN oxidoreductase RutF